MQKTSPLIGKEFTVLDHGFVKLIDHMGDDERIVQTARISYGKNNEECQHSANLINHLIKNHHTSPLEQVVFTFHIKAPIFVARQWLRHRTSRQNERSSRYVESMPEFFAPADLNDRVNSTPNADNDLPAIMKAQNQESYKVYEELLAKGLSKELARTVLPVSTYTEFYWQMDLHNLFHFLNLRMDVHAQQEIREYAQTIFTIIKEIVPLACDAFTNHIFNSVTLSRSELELLHPLLKEEALPLELKKIFKDR
jgi:thymidylate synthase (FAD)